MLSVIYFILLLSLVFYLSIYSLDLPSLISLSFAKASFFSAKSLTISSIIYIISFRIDLPLLDSLEFETDSFTDTPSLTLEGITFLFLLVIRTT